MPDVAVAEADEGKTATLKAADLVQGVLALGSTKTRLDRDEIFVAVVFLMVFGQGGRKPQRLVLDVSPRMHITDLCLTGLCLLAALLLL